MKKGASYGSQAIMDNPEIENKQTNSDRSPMTETEFTKRIANSKTLVIGADMKTYGDYSKWEDIDINYIGIRDWDNTWMRYNENQMIDWNDEYPPEKYKGYKSKEKFEKLCKKVLGNKKFRLIIVDGGTIQYIHDMETLFNLARDYMDPDGLLIYPVTQQTKTFPTGQSLLDKDTNSFCCYNFEHRDIPKLMRNNLDLVKFVNVTFNHLGLCYVMKYKEGGGTPGDSKYIDLFKLRQLKNKSSLFMAIVDETRILRETKFNEWQKEFNKWQKNREELVIDVYKGDNGNSEVSEDDITRIKESIKREKRDYNEVFDKIIPKISVEMIISFTTVNRTNSPRQTLFTLISNYESEQEKIKYSLEKAQLPADYGSGGNSDRCMSSASPPASPPASPGASPAVSRAPSPIHTAFNRKLTRKSNRKLVRKPLKKSVRKSKRKSKSKSVRKPLRKSVRKSKRKSKRKSIRKPLIKSVRKSKRKSRR